MSVEAKTWLKDDAPFLASIVDTMNRTTRKQEKKKTLGTVHAPVLLHLVSTCVASQATARPQSAAAPSSVSLSPSRCDVASQLTAPKMTSIASVRARSSTASISAPRGSLGVEDARAGGAAQRIGASAGQWRAAADGTPASWGWRTRVMGGSSG
jgi:hypothetical protein